MHRRNRVMGFVVEACNELNVELAEVWCSEGKCVFRPVDQKSQWFLFGSTANYFDVLQCIREILKL
jgi:hypothetical protein